MEGRIRQWARVGLLVGKNLRRWRGRALAMMGLVILSFSVHILYGGALSASGTVGIDTVKQLELPVDVIVTNADRFPASLLDREMAGHLSYAVGHHEETIAIPALSTRGEMTVVGIDPDSIIYDKDKIKPMGKMPTASGEMAIPDALARAREINLGDVIQLSTIDSHDGAERKGTFTVVGLFAAPFDCAFPVILKSDATKFQALPGPNQWMIQIVGAQGVTTQNTYVATTYARNMNFLTSWIKHALPKVEIVTVASGRDVAAAMVAETNSTGWTLVGMVNLFMGVGVLTISLITFLERRHELAVLKTIGIANQQIAAMLALEQAIPAALGMGIGYLLARIFGGDAAYAQLAGASWRGLVVRGIVQTSAVVFVAAFLPTLTARVATVNQLLYARVIPVVQLVISELQHQYTWLVEREREEGVRFLRLDVSDGLLMCFLLKRVGETVKQGEVIASQQSFLGLVNKEWRSPINGRITEFNPVSGYLTIAAVSEQSVRVPRRHREHRRIGPRAESPV
ncbi:MAG: ABC transporter permease [Bacillota bacterium]